MESTYSFGYWLRRRRKALDLTQEQLADRAGCVVTTIKKIEGDTRRPSRQLAEILADVLAIPLEERAAFLKAARGEQIADVLAVTAQPIGSNVVPAPAMPLPTGTVTFLFTDIEGSTQIWERHPAAMGAALARHDAMLRQAIAAHAGTVFKTVGDAFHAAFATSADALAAALEAQCALAAEAWGATGQLCVRMALHTGTAEVRDGDYFGATLNRTARLLAAGHGGQVLLSLAAAELVREHLPSKTELRDLGLHRLKDLSLPEQIFQLVAPDLLSEFPPLQTLNPRRTNLPVPLTALIGREHELAGVNTLLRQAKARLVTLTGPGGIGKTRLSLQVAAELSAEFPDGVYFVDLAPIRDASLIAATIAHTLGVRESGAQPLFDQLKDYLREKQILVLLDNFEQVLDAATVAAELLAAAPQLKLLVTSRERLHLRGEKEISVQPLAMPDSAQPPRLDQLSQYTAVELFVERAIDARADFELTSDNAPAVAEICARLDGLPLAIELAAARLKLFSPEALLARLGSRLALLSGGQRDLPRRHQTLRATTAWSYDLLEAHEQALFRRLGVFVGGSTIEAAEAVCALDEHGAIDILEGITALVDKSLLRQTEGLTGEPCVNLLETIREYALEQLEANEEAEATRRSHAAYYLSMAEAAEPRLRGAEQQVWLDQLEQEHDNVRAVLAWSLQELNGENEELSRHQVGLRLVVALARFWELRGYREEWRVWVQRAAVGLERAEATVAHAKVLLQAGIVIHDEQGDHARGVALAEESLALARALNDPTTSSWALRELGRMAHERGEQTQGVTLAEESLALARSAGDSWNSAQALYRLGEMAWIEGDHAQVRARLAESVALFEQVGDSWGRARALGILAQAAGWEGDITQAIALLEQSLALNRALGSKGGSAWTLRLLGMMAWVIGEHPRAAVYNEESLALYRDLGDRRGMASVLHQLGDLAREQGDYARATELFAESRALYLEVNDSWGIASGFLGMGDVLLNQGDARQAAASFEQAVEMYRTIGDKAYWATALRCLGRAAHVQGDDERAFALYVESLACFREQQKLQGMADCLVNIAGIWGARGQPIAAARLLGAAETLRGSSMGLTGLMVDEARDIANVRAQLDDESFVTAWAEGKGLRLEQAIAEVLQLEGMAPNSVSATGESID